MAEALRRLLGLALLLASAAASAASERPWYQVEIVLFANESPAARTTEVLTTERGPRQQATAVALGPLWPEPLRPTRTAELEMLWDSAGAAPALMRVTPGLDPETERLIRWLRRLDARSGSPDLDWLYGLEFVTWDPDAPAPRPVPEIAPEVRYVADAAADAQAEAGVDAPTPAAAAPRDLRIPLALAFRRIRPEQYRLAEEAARLGRARDFRVLAHLAWRQPFETGAPAIPVAVRWTDPATGELRLAGTVGVALRRYLHAEFDLAWLEGREIDARGEETLLWAPVEATRRMRSNETHYVDHPRVGALVRITPFELAEPLAEDAAPVAAPGD